MKLIFAIALLTSSASFAAGGLPVLDGSISQVESVSLVPNAAVNGTEIHAVIKYKGGCSAPVSFSVIEAPNFSFGVVENRKVPEPLTAQCGAVQVRSQDILVGTIQGPQPNASDIQVNGVAGK